MGLGSGRLNPSERSFWSRDPYRTRSQNAFNLPCRLCIPSVCVHGFPQSLARQPQSLAWQPQSLAQQPQCLAQLEQRRQLRLCWLWKKYGGGRGKAAPRVMPLGQPAKSELLPLLWLPTLLLLCQTLRLLGQHWGGSAPPFLTSTAIRRASQR